MPRADPADTLVDVQVTYTLPERVLRWAIAQGSRSAQRNADHIIAVLVSAHREAKVVSVKLPEGKTRTNALHLSGRS